jgi:hypothetical protein
MSQFQTDTIIYTHAIVIRFRQAGSLLDKKELNQNAACPLVRNLTSSALDLNIPLESLLDILYRGEGFTFSGLVSEKEVQLMNVAILSRCKECVPNKSTTTGICCELLACGGFERARKNLMRGACLSSVGLAERFAAGF